MSKKKKGKVIQLQPNRQSPESYIKTQARSLPVSECVITEVWQDSGSCNILVARQHKSGNFTVGVFNVDLYCLGVENAWYQFNISPDDYEFMKDNLSGMIACDYVLAHNIIYGAIAFAEDYGFKPHKGFDIARFILEEDDEAVELMELEFGLDGVPFYIYDDDDDAAEVRRITATLERTAGPGNFRIESLTDEDADIDEEDMHESMEGLAQALKLTGRGYEKIFRKPGITENIKKSTIGKGYRLSGDDKKMDQNTFDSPDQESKYAALLETFHNLEFKKAAKGLEKAILQYPDKPQFYTVLQACYYFDDQIDKMNASITDMYQRFPHYLFAKIPYANMLINEGKRGGVPDVFEGKTDLNDLYPDRKTFHTTEAAVFLATFCRYFIAIDDIDSADPYMNMIKKKNLWDLTKETLIRTAMIELYRAKAGKIRQFLKWDEE